MARAKGLFLDAGRKRFLDFNSQLMCVNIGHGDQRVDRRDAASRRRRWRTRTRSWRPSRAPGSAQKLAEIAPGDIDGFFFTNGGSEANENAIKHGAAATGRHKILARYRSYHGAHRRQR